MRLQDGSNTLVNPRNVCFAYIAIPQNSNITKTQLVIKFVNSTENVYFNYVDSSEIKKQIELNECLPHKQRAEEDLESLAAMVETLM